jgi:hypothetical protein
LHADWDAEFFRRRQAYGATGCEAERHPAAAPQLAQANIQFPVAMLDQPVVTEY